MDRMMRGGAPLSLSLLASLLFHGLAILILALVAGEWQRKPPVVLIEFNLSSAAPTTNRILPPPAPRAPRPAPRPPQAPARKAPVAPAALPQPVLAPHPPALPVPVPTVAESSLPGQNAETADRVAEEPATPLTQGSTSPAAAQAHYLAANFAYIRDRVLQRLNYPAVARRNGWEGETRVAFLIRADGQIEHLRIEQSSGRPLLDRQALAAVDRAAPFPPPPVAAELILPVAFQLR
ncbi:hypothetical protein JCM30471_34990 [Desulfuromonas carbonis]